MAGHHYRTITCCLSFLFAAAVVFAARDLDGANPFPAPAGRQQAGPYYGYGAGGIPGFLPGVGFSGGPGNGGGPAGNGIPSGGTGAWGAGYGGHAHGGGVEVHTVVDCNYKCTASC